MTFKDLLNLFEGNKGKDIKLSKTNDKYIIQVYNNDYHTNGNLRIKYSTRLDILFNKNKVAVSPCKYGQRIYKLTKIFKLDDNIMKMKDLISIDFLNSLVDYNDKK